MRGVAAYGRAATAATAQGSNNSGWPPAVHAAPPESPVLSPADEMKTFAMPPGYHVELVASEPMIEEPILIDWDPQGRLWVIEMIGYMQDIAGTTEHEPLGRVSVLEDRDGDGQMDKKTVFLDKLVLPRALKVLDRGVLVGEPPNLWFVRDTNGDLKADSKELVTNQYGRRDANVEHNANTLLWALDNWMHTSETDIYLRLRNGAFDVRKNAVSRTVGRVTGRWRAHLPQFERIGAARRSRADAVLRAQYQPAAHARQLRVAARREERSQRVWPARPTPGVNRGYQAGVLRPDGRLASYTAVSSPTVYRGDRLPADLRGNVFVVDPAANVVSRIIIQDDGTKLVARKAYDQAEFLSSTDERFRPVYLTNAPDGGLYLVDMYHGIIQHRDYITEYLRDQILSRQLQGPLGHGRIYRIVHDSMRPAAPAPARPLTSAQLVSRLSDANGWWRDTAQRILVERGDVTVAPALVKLATSSQDERVRLHALWTLDGLDRLDIGLVKKALTDPARDVRLAGLRLSERWLTSAPASIQEQCPAAAGRWRLGGAAAAGGVARGAA